ncbi:hypothetical protein A2U01_0073870, partial [Trifolium medium]|nr:hypothetical protein [Trifolium medium]
SSERLPPAHFSTRFNDDVQGMRDKEPLDKPDEGDFEEEVERRPDTPSPGDSSNLRPNPRGGSRDQVVMTKVSSALLKAQVRSTVRMHRNKRTSSCPP